MFLCPKYLLYSTEVLLDIYRVYVQQISVLSMVNISSRYRNVSLNVSMRSNSLGPLQVHAMSD